MKKSYTFVLLVMAAIPAVSQQKITDQVTIPLYTQNQQGIAESPVIINNRTLMQDFINNPAYSASQNLDTSNNALINGSLLGNEYTTAFNSYWTTYLNSGMDDAQAQDAANTAAVAYILNNYDTGISLLKTDSDNTNFNTVFSYATVNNNGETVYKNGNC